MTKEIVKIMKRKSFEELSGEQKLAYIESSAQKLAAVQIIRPFHRKALDVIVERIPTKAINIGKLVLVGGVFLSSGFFFTNLFVDLLTAKGASNPFSDGIFLGFISGSLPAAPFAMVFAIKNSFIKKSIAKLFKRNKLPEVQKELDAVYIKELESCQKRLDEREASSRRIEKLIESVVIDFNDNSKTDCLTFTDNSFKIVPKDSRISFIGEQLTPPKMLEGKH